MNEILSELSKPSWWLTVVVVGLMINLLAAFLKNPIDRVISLFSTKWRERLERAKISREKELDNLNDIQILISTKLDLLNLLVLTVGATVVGMVLIFSMDKFMSLIGDVLFFSGLIKFRASQYLEEIAVIFMQATVTIFMFIFFLKNIITGIHLENLLSTFEKRKKNKRNPYSFI